MGNSAVQSGNRRRKISTLQADLAFFRGAPVVCVQRYRHRLSSCRDQGLPTARPTASAATGPSVEIGSLIEALENRIGSAGRRLTGFGQADEFLTSVDGRGLWSGYAAGRSSSLMMSLSVSDGWPVSTATPRRSMRRCRSSAQWPSAPGTAPGSKSRTTLGTVPPSSSMRSGTMGPEAAAGRFDQCVSMVANGRFVVSQRQYQRTVHGPVPPSAIMPKILTELRSNPRTICPATAAATE